MSRPVLVPRVPLVLFAGLVACAPEAVGPGGGDTGGSLVAPDWTPPDQPGPYGVGVRTLTWTDARGKDLTAEVWYPAIVDPDEPASNYDPFVLAINAHRDAPFDARGTPHPLAAFSHGFAAIRFQSAFLMEHLASRGWVVVAPDHNLNTFLDIDASATARVTVERPGDIRESVDHLLGWAADRDDAWATGIDGSRYAMLGHSFGALTTLVVAGGTVDLTGIVERCASGEGDGQACRYIDDIDPEAILGTQEADPRAEVAVPLSPGVWYGFGVDGAGLSTVVPALVLGGTQDNVLDYEDEIVPTYSLLSGPKRFGIFAGGGHYVFTDICLIASFFSPECDDPEGWIDLAAAQETTRALVAAWLDVHFLGLDEAAPWTTVEGLGSPAFLSMEAEE